MLCVLHHTATLRATGLSQSDIDAAFTTDPTSTPIRVERWGHLGDSWPYFRPNFTNMEADRVAAGAQEVGFACAAAFVLL